MTKPADWRWLQDTYWYVPPGGLPALQLDTDTRTLAWVVDQTVWHITGYRDGYVWGASATLLRSPGHEPPKRGPGSRPACFTMLGSITPQGQVHLTFIPGASSRSATTGVGEVVHHDGGPRFQMQMSSGSGTVTAHWASMAPVRPGDPSWDRLPGVEMSVPEMLEGCEPPEPARDTP